MKDYWRLIGIAEDATEDQIRQAHFRTFRLYQGRKNESKNAAHRAVAELVIDYLRNAQYNYDLPIPSSLRHLLPAEPNPVAIASPVDETPVKVAPPTPLPASSPVQSPAVPAKSTDTSARSAEPLSKPPDMVLPASPALSPALSNLPAAPITRPLDSPPLNRPAEHSVHSANEQLSQERVINFNGSLFLLSFPPENKLADAVRKIPGCFYSTGVHSWCVPLSADAAQPLMSLAKAYFFRLEENARLHLERLIKAKRDGKSPLPVAQSVPSTPSTPSTPSAQSGQPVSDTETVPPTQKFGPLPVADPVVASKATTLIDSSAAASLPSAKPVSNRSVDKEILQADNERRDRQYQAERSLADSSPQVSTSQASTSQASNSQVPDTKLSSISSSGSIGEPDDDIMLEPVFDNEPTTGDLISDTPPSLHQSLTKALGSGRQLIIGDVINCPDCEWDILSQTDSYCSGCGKSITSVSVPTELLVYISDTGSYTKSFRITNDGLIPITIGSFQVIDIDATVQPAEMVVLGKGESLNVQLRVTENNPFGKRSGRLRFLYHDKPKEIPILLKEPPRIWLAFPDVPTVRPIENGLLLRLPVSQIRFGCQLQTDSEAALTISAINLDNGPLVTVPVQIKRDQPHLLQIESRRSSDLMMTIVFQELGSRRFRLLLQRVEVPNLTDKIDPYSIGENAIILGSGICESTLLIKNQFDSVSGKGKGSAQKIQLQGAPEWLSLEPVVIPQLASGESWAVRLAVDSSKIKSPCREHINLTLHYFDPQLECEQQRPERVQLPFEFIEPRQYDDWIAIDFGTSNSCAAILEGAKIRSLIIDAVNHNPNPKESPSCIQFVDEAAKLYECGMTAYTKRFTGARAIKSTAWAFKPQLSRLSQPVPQTYLDILQGRPHTKTVDELITIYAHSLIEAVRLRNGIAPHKAVVTFPVTFGKFQRERLAEAFRRAGFEEVITPVSEPVALAIHYAYLHREIFNKPALFAIFDFGGGTTDLAIFESRPPDQEKVAPQLQLLDVSGIDLGGELLTFELARFIYQLLVPANERAEFAFPATLEELTSGNSDVARENFRHLATFAEHVKRSVGEQSPIFDEEFNQNLISNNNSNKTFKAQLKRGEIEALLRPRIEELIKVLIAMVSALHERGKIPAKRLDCVILGGNSSRLPLVTEMLADALFEGDRTRVLLDLENIKTGVTKGALLYAVAPEALPFPVDQVNHTLPCRIGLLAAGYRFDMLFERGMIATGSEDIVRRQITMKPGKEFLRLFYYFGHESNPNVLGNPKMREYAIPCAAINGEVEVSFRLLPECEGIEIILRVGDREIREVAPILGAI